MIRLRSPVSNKKAAAPSRKTAAENDTLSTRIPFYSCFPIMDASSTIRFEYPVSLSYQDMTFTIF
jgi:hypothetical protein